MKLVYSEEELPQRSPEWLELRNKTIGGSEVGTILGLLHKYEKPETLWKRKTGRLKPKKMNSAMERGNLLENEAIEEVKKQLPYKNPVIRPCFALHPEHEFASVSFDGVDHENGYIVEIKCPQYAWNFKSVIEKGVQDYYYPQVQWQLMVSDALWDINEAYFCSYFPDGVYVAEKYEFTETLRKLSINAIAYDPKYCEEMLKVVKVFRKFVSYDYWDFEEYKEVLDGFYNNTFHEVNPTL